MKTTAFFLLLVLFTVEAGYTQSSRPASSGGQTASSQVIDLLFTSAIGFDRIVPANRTWLRGSSQGVTLVIRNAGDMEAGAFNVRLYLSTDDIITPSDTEISPLFRITRVAPNATLVTLVTVTAPDVGTGTYYVGGILDVDNEVVESNEANNAAASPFTIEVASITPPASMGLGQVGSYMQVDWSPPAIPNATRLDNPRFVDTGASCPLGGGLVGDVYTITVDYTDPDGDVTGGVAVNDVLVELSPFGALALPIPGTLIETGNGFGGTLSVDVCLTFFDDDAFDLAVSILDLAENSSNFLSLTIPNPDLPQAPPSGGPALSVSTVTPGEGGSPPSDGALRLRGYNVYRRDLTSGGPRTLIATLPPDRTSFTDEFTDFDTRYQYSITARYTAGESQEIGDVDQTAEGEDPSSFDRVVTGDVFTNAGRSIGGVWGDLDNDGDLDLFIANGGPADFLFENRGGALVKIDAGDLVTDPGDSFSASWGDCDNDGLLDLFVPDFFGQASLYLNNGNRTFNRVQMDVETRFATGGSWVDYDLDGDLDLFVTRGGGLDNRFYRNDGACTLFPLTAQQIGSIVADGGRSNNGIWGDFNNDGYPDVFVANFDGNFLYRNDGPPGFTFTRVTSGPIAQDAARSIGGSWGDYDGDGDLDLFVANEKETNFLYRNDDAPAAAFARVTSGPVVQDADARDSFGSSWGDYDNDGDLDLFVSNADGVNFLYRNGGGGSFERIQNQGTQMPGIANDAGASRGVSWADFNADGGVDLLVLDQRSNNYLYVNKREENGTPNQNGFLRIRCIGTLANRAAIGARVSVTATINGTSRTQVREITGQTGRGGQNSMDLTFGLGNASRVERIVVEWPSESPPTELRDVAVNQTVEIREPEQVVYTISGRVVDGAGSPLDGVTMTLGGAAQATQQTDGNGDYAFDNLSDGVDYTVTPSKEGFSFDPATRSFDNLGQNETANFTGTPVTTATYTIAGRVLDDAGTPLSGVTMTLGGGAQATQQVDANGRYAFADLPEGDTYTVTPSRDGYTFNPPERTFETLSQDETGNFIGSQARTYSIGGVVLTNAGDPLADVTMTLDGTLQATQQTDAQGAYAFSGIPEGGTYAVAPSRAGFTFNPDQRSFIALGADVAEANFIGTPGTDTAAEDADAVPDHLVLYANYPNPFAGRTHIPFDVPKPTRVRLTVYNLLGVEVGTVLDEVVPAGRHRAAWDAAGLASGVYLYRLEAGRVLQTRKLIVLGR